MKKRIRSFLFLCVFFLGICKDLPSQEQGPFEIATFSGGCFWCMQPPFDAFIGKGVIQTRVGYTGGRTKNPTYEEVSSGNTGYAESVEVIYDPKKIDYRKLLDIFWRNIDPTVQDRQFCDIGSQYRSAIFYHNDSQRELAENSKEEMLKKLAISKIYTEIQPAKIFYPAEEYHQKYYQKHPFKYKIYRFFCGRDRRLEEIWGKEKR